MAFGKTISLLNIHFNTIKLTGVENLDLNNLNLPPNNNKKCQHFFRILEHPKVKKNNIYFIAIFSTETAINGHLLKVCCWSAFIPNLVYVSIKCLAS